MVQSIYNEKAPETFKKSVLLVKYLIDMIINDTSIRNDHINLLKIAC
jgi:acetyl-CoA carboxylase beta subunit